MITECYIKGRYDYGVGKCAVVITEDVQRGQEKVVLHQVAWRTPESWQYGGETIVADQQNCEILAATYALQWCMQQKKNLVNIYTNTTTCQKWYFRGEFPESRKAAGRAYLEMMDAYMKRMDDLEGNKVNERIFADYIPKNDKNPWNWLVNDIALNVK